MVDNTRGVLKVLVWVAHTSADSEGDRMDSCGESRMTQNDGCYGGALTGTEVALMKVRRSRGQVVVQGLREHGNGYGNRVRVAWLCSGALGHHDRVAEAVVDSGKQAGQDKWLCEVLWDGGTQRAELYGVCGVRKDKIGLSCGDAWQIEEVTADGSEECNGW